MVYNIAYTRPYYFLQRVSSLYRLVPLFCFIFSKFVSNKGRKSFLLFNRFPDPRRKLYYQSRFLKRQVRPRLIKQYQCFAYINDFVFDIRTLVGVRSTSRKISRLAQSSSYFKRIRSVPFVIIRLQICRSNVNLFLNTLSIIAKAIINITGQQIIPLLSRNVNFFLYKIRYFR